MSVNRACKNCFWSEEYGESEYRAARLECHLHAPVVIQRVDGGEAYSETCWPIVRETDFCGDWKAWKG